MPAAPRILVVRFSSIGDILLTTPLLRALREALPGAHLGFLTKRAFVPLLSANPRLDEVIALEPGMPLRELARVIRRRGFTHRLDLHGSLRSRALRLLAPGRWSGYRNHRLAREVLIRFKRDTYPRTIPVPERYFDAARGLGVRPDGGPPEFHLSAEARAEATAWLARSLPEPARPLAVLAPGAAHATKRWPGERWGELARGLAARGFAVALAGGTDDQETAGRIADASPAVSAAGTLSLQGTGALLAAARVAVTGDTGVMHMATAVGTPVAAIFGPTVRAFGFFPYGGPAAVLEQALACRPCTAWGTARCPLGHHRCMLDTSAARVEAAVAELLG